MENTKVIATEYGPREVQNWSQQINDKALVRCEYSMANFSTGDRMRKQKGDRRFTEISLVIRQTMEACILMHLMPRSQIDIFVQVLQADGGTRSACINAATLALADSGIPMSDLVTSCSAGYLNSTPLFDLNYVEDSAGGADVTVGILAKLDKVTPLQMDGKLLMDTFENVMQLAVEGCKAIANYIREVLLENTKKLERRHNSIEDPCNEAIASEDVPYTFSFQVLRNSKILEFTIKLVIQTWIIQLDTNSHTPSYCIVSGFGAGVSVPSSEPPCESDSCGMSYHLECVLKDKRAGIAKETHQGGLDGSYNYISCRKVNDLLECWRKQLMMVKDTRRVDTLCYHVSLSQKLLFGTKKYQKLIEIVKIAAKKLETEVGPGKLNF
ncbi:hypothetical protein GIB67_011279 [Kingdonia uniflora]|uniref:Uncharacterized protein n=1 Tax=Kingdonia uniflora TaxID=39325 RepID=A0A7J7MP45_9MAGN|nr:hypothetical protein GIB67_011279 [Kingdonia uniflora]